MQLEYTVRPGNCLQAASGDNLPSIDSCNASTATQQWKLDEDGKLQNYVTNHGFHCADLESLTIEKNCTEFSGQWTCLPFALKIHENHYLAVRERSTDTSQDFKVYHEKNGTNNVIWRKYRDTSGNTCNNSGKISDVNPNLVLRKTDINMFGQAKPARRNTSVMHALRHNQNEH